MRVALAILLVIAAAASSAAAATPQVVKSGDRRYLTDGAGNELLLRGINSNSLVEYPDYFQQTVPLTRGDVREMAALGFNFLRLPINWSRLAPQPGAISKPYLRQIERIVGWAESAGLRVLVDFHQDRYNRNLRPNDEADGSPDWATFTDGKPCAPGPLTSPCSVAAYDAFWNDRQVAGKGLQFHYLDAMLAVSRRLRDHPQLLGFELMNEPTPGSTGSPDFERLQLWPFERRMIYGLRAHGERRPIWFGPSILRDVTDQDPGRPESLAGEGNYVYAPHIYTGTFNGGGVPQLEASFLRAEAEARAYRAAWVNAEWSAATSDPTESLRDEVLRLLDAYRVGSGFWMWKQRPGFYNWHTVEVDGSLRTDSRRAAQLSRAHVDSVPGELVSTRVEPSRLSFRVRGPGGTAQAWSGTAPLNRALVTAYVDGQPVRAQLRARRYDPPGTTLLGWRVRVPVPAGTHEVELR